MGFLRVGDLADVLGDALVGSLAGALAGARNSNFGGSLRFSRNCRRWSGSSAAQFTLSRCMRRNC
jgi:hypothetical protein